MLLQKNPYISKRDIGDQETLIFCNGCSSNATDEQIRNLSAEIHTQKSDAAGPCTP